MKSCSMNGASTCKRVGAQIRSPVTATGGLASGFEAAGGAAQDRAGPGAPLAVVVAGRAVWGAAAAEGAAVISTRLRVPFELVLRLSPRNVPGIDS